MELKSKILFLQEIDKLKQIERKTLTHTGDRYENSAEHSWHLALAVLVLHPHANIKNFDAFKAIKMALLHDIVEIDAGDTIIYGDNSQKAEKEMAAAQRIFGILPSGTESLKDLWEEFELKESAEAKFVGALDRFLPILSNYLNDGHSWQEHKVYYEQVVEKNKAPILAGFPDLWILTQKMLEETIAKGNLLIRG